MRARVLRGSLGAFVVVLSACGTESPARDPSPAASAPTDERRPGEGVIVARWNAAQAEVTRIEGERRAAETPGGDRRARLRRVIERDHELALATLARDEAELDFYALACADTVRSIGESHHAAAAEERDARARWLVARLEGVDADVALTDLVEDESATEAAIERATDDADSVRARAAELEETVSESFDRRSDLRLEAREACDERMPGQPR